MQIHTENFSARSESDQSTRANRFTGRLLAAIRAWSDRIDARPLAYRHRMGAWESIASPAAQQALRQMQRQASLPLESRLEDHQRIDGQH